MSLSSRLAAVEAKHTARPSFALDGVHTADHRQVQCAYERMYYSLTNAERVSVLAILHDMQSHDLPLKQVIGSLPIVVRLSL